MKRKILLLISVFAVFAAVQATDDYWVDVNFTRDSTMWKEALPAMAVVSTYNFQCTPDPATEYLGHIFDGTIGKFAVSNYSYTPFNAENLSEKFIYAFRLANTSTTTNWTLPGTPDVGKIKMHLLCGNVTAAGEFSLQKYISGEGAEAVWQDFDPAIKFVAPAHNNSTTSFVVEQTLNLVGPIKLRLKGPAGKNVHIYTLTISKSTNSAVPENLMNKIGIDLKGRTLQINSDGLEYNATVFNLAGLQVCTLKNDEACTLTSAGVYMVRVMTAEGSFSKKITVF
ncbi:MAG: T9SS type A sorting domain-containing protein [Paludibacter sp.]|nr:T9SS type A sorting domain-containing protein [Paludibacter sp.]